MEPSLYSHITGVTGSTVICPKPAILEEILINTAVTGATITPYDFATVTGVTGALGVITMGANPYHQPYCTVMQKGIVVNNSNSGVDLTVTYRPL